MAVDIAVLGLEVRSDGVVVASDRLRQFTTEGGRAEQATGKLSSSFSNLEKYVQAAQAAFAAAGIGLFVKSSIDAALQIERMNQQFKVFTGNANLAARELEFVRNEANRLGLASVELTTSYGRFLNAIKGTANEGEKGRKAFIGISEGMAAIRLAADEQSRIWAQLNQGLMKGKFEMEDLKTINEAGLPIFKLMADALGKDVSVIMKMQAEGKILAADVLPKIGESMHQTFGVSALEGANSTQAAINRMNNEMLQTKATLGAALIPAFTDALTALRPFLEMIQQVIGGLQIMSIKAAGLYDRMTTNSGGNTLEEKLSNIAAYRARSKADEEAAITDLMKRYTPTGSDYTAAERFKQSSNKPQTGLPDNKGAKEAERYRQAVLELRKDIDMLSTSMTHHEKALFSASVEYDKLVLKYPKHRVELEGMRAEKIRAIQSEHDLKTAIAETVKEFEGYARVMSEESAWSQTADSIDEQHRLFIESVRLMDTTAKASQEVADSVYEVGRAYENLTDQAAAIDAIISKLYDLKGVQESITDANIGLINDPYIQQMAMLEERYRREKELINEKMAALEDSNLTETAMYKALNDKLLIMGVKLNKDLADSQREQSKAGWDSVVSQAQKAFPKLTGIDKLLTAAFEKHTVMRLDASGKAVKDETASNLSMYSAYADAVGGMFAGMAASQDQSSREGFETAKAFNMAAAVMSTASGIMNQYSSGDPYTANFRAAIVAAVGAIQIAQIASTSFGGGGASAPSAPSGSFAGSGGSSSNGTGLSNLKTPLMSMEDTRSQETYERMIASSDSVVEAIGRLSKSMDDLTAIFEEGGAGYSLATNAPQTALTVGGTQKSPFGTSSLINSLGNALGVNGVESFFKTVGTLGIADIVESMFASENKITESGMALAVQNGMVTASQMLRRETGSWWSGSKTHYEYTSDPELQSYMQSVIDPFIADIQNMALTLGTTVDFSKFSSDLTNIQVAGKTTEEVAKQLENWTLETLQGLSLTVQGLAGDGGVIGNYDDAYVALKRLNDGIVTLKDSFLLIGKTVVEGTLANAQAADALITSMGGIDDFNEAIDTYFTSMFTDVEQEAAKNAEAKRKVDSAFLEMDSLLPKRYESILDHFDAMTNTAYMNVVESASKMPQTREEFRNLVNSLDVTTDSGAALFASLMSVSEAFGIAMEAADDAAEKLREIQQATQDLDVRYLKATGKSDAADALERQLSAQREIEQAIAGDMGDAYINRLREVLAAEASTTASMQDYTEQRAGLQEQLDQLMGVRTDREITLAKITDDVSRAMQARIYLLQDEKALLTQRAGLQDQYDVAAGNKTQHDIDLAKISDPWSRAMQARIYGLQDEQNALTANTAALKSAVDTSNTAMQTAKSNLQAAFDAEKDRLTAAYDLELKRLNSNLDAASETVSRLTSYVDKLKSSRQSMSLDDAAYQASQYSAAQASMAAVLVQARGGDLSGIETMDESLSILTNQGADAYANSTDYQRDFWRTSNSISELENLAGNQLTDAQRANYLAQQQIDTLESNHTAQLAAMDAQLNALLGLNVAAMSIADAIAGLTGAQASYAAASAAMPVTPVATTTPTKITYSKEAILTYIDDALQRHGGANDAFAYDIYTRAARYGVSSAELVNATKDKYGWQQSNFDEWAKSQGLPLFASGGITSGISIAGEAGPEAVVPLPDGRRIPVQMTGSADNWELIEELRLLRAEQKIQAAELAKWQQKTSKTLDKWDGDGMPAVAA